MPVPGCEEINSTIWGWNPLSDDEVIRMQEQIVTLFKNDERQENALDKVLESLDKIKDQLASRLPVWATMLIAALTAACGFLAGK